MTLTNHILITGGVHGDEPVGPYYLTHRLNRFQSNANFNYIVIPCINPDGYERNTRTNKKGVDLNRDFKSGEAQSLEAQAVKDRDIYCVPTLYGCSLGCTFCFLTTLNVSKTNKPISWERIKECLSHFDNTKPKRQNSLIGAGDPSLNQKFIEDCCAEEEMVSLASIFPIQMPKQPKNLKIHYSLHAMEDAKRKVMMPSAKVAIEDVFKYLSEHEGNKEIHYTLIEDQNDSNEELQKLLELSQKYRHPIKFLHFKESGNNKASSRLNFWINTLSQVTKVEFYAPPGDKIQGSCGQFTNFFYKNEFESLPEYKKYHEAYAIK